MFALSNMLNVVVLARACRSTSWGKINHEIHAPIRRRGRSLRNPAYNAMLDPMVRLVIIRRTMTPPSETAALGDAKRLLSGWLDGPKPRFRTHDRTSGADLVVEHGRLRLVVELKRVGDSAIVGRAVEEAKRYARHVGPAAVAVVAVPYMGEVGRRLCAEGGVSWFDLSGNAHIVAPGLRILIDGRPNEFTRRGRPSTAFAPKSARIARRLLIEPSRPFRQQELARVTGLDDGFTSRIVRRLEGDGLLDRDQDGSVRVRDPDLLLDAWAEAYDFEKHSIIRGHVSARASEKLLNRVGQVLTQSKVKHAATGLGAAWLLTGFAGFRLATFFVEERPSEAILRDIGFREEPKGANLWLVIPNDEGVYDGASKRHGVMTVHPVQAYVDLLGHPERAKEARDELRARMLRGKP